MKECYNCKSTVTYVNKIRGYAEWRFKEENRYCLKCYNRLFYCPSHKEQRKQNAKIARSKQKGRRIYFKGKRIIVKNIVRTGYCSECNNGIKKLTHIHHKYYNDLDPLDGIVELCPKHHMEESKKLGQFHGKTKRY